MISYNNLLASGVPANIRLLALLACSDRAATTDDVEAEGFSQQCDQLFADGLIGRVIRGKENVDGVTWHTFEARVERAAWPYIAELAKERLLLSREPYTP